MSRRRSPNKYSEEKTPKVLGKSQRRQTDYIFPDDISNLIASYNPSYEFLPWIDEGKISLYSLARNTNIGAIPLFQKLAGRIGEGSNDKIFLTNSNPEIVEWYLNKTNPEDFNKISIEMLDRTPVGRNYKQVYWEELGRPKIRKPSLGTLISSYNPVELKKALREKNWDIIKEDEDLKYELSKNSLPEAIDFLNDHPEMVSWAGLSANPNPKVVNFLLKNPEKIDWRGVKSNPNPLFAPYIRNRIKNGPLSPGDWEDLNSNPLVVDILEKNRNKIDYTELSTNPGIIRPIQGESFSVLQSLQRSGSPKRPKRSR